MSGDNGESVDLTKSGGYSERRRRLEAPATPENSAPRTGIPAGGELASFLKASWPADGNQTGSRESEHDSIWGNSSSGDVPLDSSIAFIRPLPWTGARADVLQINCTILNRGREGKYPHHQPTPLLGKFRTHPPSILRVMPARCARHRTKFGSMRPSS